MRVEFTKEQWALAVEILGSEANARYMLYGAGLRSELTMQLLDALAAERSNLEAAAVLVALRGSDVDR